MSLQDLSSYTAAMGRRAFVGDGHLWVEKKAGFLDSFPPHRPICLPAKEARRFFWRGVAAIRHTCDSSEGLPSFEYIWDDKNFGMHSLHRYARRNVRRNIDSCVVRSVEFELLAKEACAINRSAFARQKRPMNSLFTDDSRWNEYMKACGRLPALEAYGAFVEGRLCGYSLAMLVDDYCYLVHTSAATEYLKYCPMNILIYSIVETMLARQSVRRVSAGLESFTPHPTIEQFKLGMGCRKSIIYRRVVMNPVARPIFSRPGASLTTAFLKYVRPGLVADFASFSQYVQRAY